MLQNHTERDRGFQQLADARRALKVANSLRKASVLDIDERLAVEQVRVLAIRCIEAATADLIETLDVLDDPDQEPDGDELDGNGAEDDFMSHGHNGPGCPLADPPEHAKPETLRQTLHMRSLPHEDAEDCEGGGDAEVIEDEPGFTALDRRIANRRGDGPGCIISDPDFGGEEAGEFDEGI